MSRVRVGSGALYCPAFLHHPTLQCVCCHSIVGLVACFVTGLCHCGMAVMVCVGWNGGVCEGVVVLLFVFLCFPSSSLCLVGVRGSARAAPRARTLSPNTIVFLVSCCSLAILSSFLLAFSRSAFLCLEWRGGSPCVRVFGGHDSNRESVSFVFVFLVVACSSFASSSVASSAVASGAEDSAVVWVIGSA
nr:MAG TPA: hypothetical protein [Caudoviricetes sp.]